MLGLNTYATTKNGEAVDMILTPRISAMDCAFSSFNFIVTLNEFTFGFQSVSGFSIEKNVDYISEGGVNDHEIMVEKPSYEHPTLTFKRGMIMRKPKIISEAARAAAAAIPDNIARKAALIGINMVDPQEALDSGPSLGIIRVFSRERTLKAMYSFLSLGTIAWRGDDLDASSGNILCEEFTVAHTGLTRHSLDPIPPIVDSIVNLVSDAKTFSNAQSVYIKAKEAKERKEAAEELKRKKEEELALNRERKKQEKELEEEKRMQQRLKEELAKKQKEKELEAMREEKQKERDRRAEERNKGEEAKKEKEKELEAARKERQKEKEGNQNNETEPQEET